ncbi:ribosome recycling factor [Acetobacterium paludosum]|uniref:Ribosome-recycling factor n=1 Tax=Acetobacterium paludosum TaxID=52693 RepID=A0A923I4M4_9FIRM|nr:ribosome recycling factor [Acetobacterium paludosum]MBC3888930.1 ribosome recycling factor [Acetobacterium paludosum]
MVNEIKATTNEKMAKALINLNESLGSLRAGRANPRILDRVMVDYYGSPTSLNQLANISTPEPRMIVIQPYDATSISAIEKGILKSDLGFNPSNDGKIIRLLIPQLTEERRKELVKLVKKYGEECKVTMRNIRRHAIQDLKDAQKEGLITEDDLKQGEKEIQKVTDDEIKNIEQILKDKEVEILEV